MTSHYHISQHLIWHCMRCSIAPYSASHFVAHHSHISLNKAYPTSGIAKRSTSPNSTSHHVVCDLVELNMSDVEWCEMWYVCYAGNVVRCEMLSCGSEMWNVTHCHYISHLTTSLPPHLHSIIPHQTPSRTLTQTTPHSTSHHHSSPYRTFRIAPASLAAH